MTEKDTPQARSRSQDRQLADLDLAAGPAKLHMRVEVTPAGLLSIGALVSGILLSTAALIWVATAVAREHPLATRIRPR